MAESVSFSSIATELSRRQYRPVYLLHGEEGYFIDRLVQMAENIVPEADRDFNLYTVYGLETDASSVMDMCRRYPMMSDRIVVIVKEAQNNHAKSAFLKALATYAENPVESTILVIAWRGEQAKAKELTAAIKKSGGVVFESPRLRDRALQSAISDFIRGRGLSVEPKALAMLTDYVGSDLSRIDNEIGKLTVTLGQGAMVTPEAIERNIGVSKDYNNFELVSALARRDAAAAMRIVRYFAANPKNNPVVLTLSAIFTLFQNILVAQYGADKSERGVMNELGFKWPVQARDVITGMRNFHPAAVIEIISAIRRCDAAGKGVGSRANLYDLLTELVFFIMNPVVIKQ